MSGKCAEFYPALVNGKACGMQGKSVAPYIWFWDVFCEELLNLGCIKRDTADIIKVSHLKPITTKIGRSVDFRCLKLTSPIRKELINYFFNCVISKKPPQANEIVHITGDSRYWTEEQFKENFTEEALQARMKYRKTNFGMIINRSHTYKNNNPNHNISDICSSGQMHILLSMISEGYGDDEYTAFCTAMKWAAERLEAEKSAKEAQP